MIKTRKQLKQYEDTILSKYNTENLDIHYAKNRTYIWLQYWFDCHPSVYHDDPDFDPRSAAMRIYNRFTDKEWMFYPIARLNAAGIIYLSCIVTGRGFSQDEIAQDFQTTTNTIRKYCQKIKRLCRY